MESKDVRWSLLLTVVMLLLASDGGYCNMQQIRNVRRSIRSNAVIRVERSPSVVLDRDSRSASHRSRRSLLNQVEMIEALDAHNAGRRKEGASNMEIMTSNNDLANMADAWAQRCIWQHGQAYSPPSTLAYRTVGQNLYAIGGASTINITSAILAWYNEKPYFNYDTLGCQSGQQCGHYTQIVWGTSRELGCAYANCSTLQSSDLTNALFLVCNYGPAGNVNGSKPYPFGPACSKCSTGSWWCNEGLCDRSCTTTGPKCGCAPVCLNFATVNGATCSCSCTRGWYGSDCSLVCKNYDMRCNPQPGQYGWPPEWCNHIDMGETVREQCPAMCNRCQVLSTSSSMKPTPQSMMAVWLSALLLYSFFRSI